MTIADTSSAVTNQAKYKELLKLLTKARGVEGILHLPPPYMVARLRGNEKVCDFEGSISQWVWLLARVLERPHRPKATTLVEESLGLLCKRAVISNKRICC